jgi:hypothetical protein
VTIQLGMTEVARTLRQILAPHSGTWCTNTNAVNWGLTDHLLALLGAFLGDADEGRRLLGLSIDAYRAAETRTWLAVALADLAELTDDVRVAQAAAAEAVEVALGIGAPAIAQRATAAAEAALHRFPASTTVPPRE